MALQFQQNLQKKQKILQDSAILSMGQGIL